VKNFLKNIQNIPDTHYVLRFTFYFLSIMFIICGTASSQEVPYHISNTPVYEFLEEMANAQLIDINTTARPWSRKYIAGKLDGLQQEKELLNARQKKELAFYLKDFNKELKPDKHFKKRFDILYYKDSLFTFSVNAILGIRYWNNSNGMLYHRWNGAEAFAYVGNHWGFYASLRDNHDSRLIRNPGYLNEFPAANYKGNGDFSEMRGGVTWSWSWGSVGLMKDNFLWGDNVHGSNIFSGRTPSFAQIYLHLKPVKWFEFRYIHGWLVSAVVDSTRSYWFLDGSTPEYRKVYYPKYLAANLFMFTPIRRLNLSFGNSIVYTDIGLYPAYLIPFMFFKSVDHTVNAGIDNMNSQMFFDVSSRQIKNLHLYTSLFIDEIAISRMFDKDRHSNFCSFKIGGELTDFPLRNTGIKGEYTRTNPLTFQHYVPTLTFESNRYNLGNYLKDNAREYYVAAFARPLRGLYTEVSWSLAQKGPDYTPSGNHDRLGLPFMESVDWGNMSFTVSARYQVINDGYLFASFCHRNVTGNPVYTADYWQGETDSFSFGLNFGF